MDVRWVDAIINLWKNDLEMDLAALETQWQLRPLETRGPVPGEEEEERGRLLCCMTGFDDRESPSFMSVATLLFLYGWSD